MDEIVSNDAAVEASKVVLGNMNETYQYGVNLYLRWCEEKNVDPLDNHAKEFLVDHKKGWPTNAPKTVGTIRMRLQAIKYLYKTNNRNYDLGPLAKKLASLDK